MGKRVHRLLEYGPLSMKVLCDRRNSYQRGELLVDELENSEVTCRRCLAVLNSRKREGERKSK